MNTLQMKIPRIYILVLLLFLLVLSVVLAQKAKSMTNADVIEMVKAGLSEQIITTSIRQASAKSFDLTPVGLIALKKAGVSDAIIQVLQEVTSKTKSSPNIENNKLSVSVESNKLPSDDKELAVKSVLNQRVAAQSRGDISLLNFRKTNGFEQGSSQLYVVEWQADIIFEQAGYKAGDMFVGYWQDFSVLQQKPGTLDSLVVGNTIRFDKGTKVRLTGNSTLRKTEQGWRTEELSVKSYRVLVGQYIAPDGEFSYNVPDGWELKDLPGIKYKVAFLISPIFATNIIIFGDSISGTLDDFVVAKTQEIIKRDTAGNDVVMSKTEFLTNSGQRGVRVIIDSDQVNDRLRSYFYFFDGKNGKAFIAQCTALQKDAAFEKVFDESMKTFKMSSSASSANDKTLKDDDVISSYNSIQQELVLIERRLTDAQIAGYKGVFGILLADDFLYVENGKSYNKQWFLENMMPLKETTVDIEGVEYLPSSNRDAATLTGTNLIHLQDGSTVRYEFISKFVKRGGHWKKTASELTKIGYTITKEMSVSTGLQDIEKLGSLIEKGENAYFNVKCDSTVYPKHTMNEGKVLLNKTAISFDGENCKGFNTTAEKIIEVTYQPEKYRISLIVMVKNPNGIENKRGFDIYNVNATAPESGDSIYCNSCDDSLKVLYELLRKVRFSSTIQPIIQ